MTLRNHCLSLCILITLFITGCDGGLVGTSTGPKIVTGDVPRLPNKISLVLPKSIAGKHQLDIGSDKQSVSIRTTRQVVAPQTSSMSWSLLQPSLQEIDATRIAVQEMLALLDTEFDAIVQLCAGSFLQSGSCAIEAGEISASYDETVTQKMIAIHQTANAGTPATEIVEDLATAGVRARYLSLEGSAVTFNDLTVQLVGAGAQEYSLITSADGLLQGRELQLNWNPLYDQITYEVTDTAVGSQVERYNYRNTASGQRLTVQRHLNSAALNTEIFTVEFTAQPSDVGEVFYNARVDGHYISGQASEETAYAYTRDFDDDDSQYSEEFFDEFGYLIAVQECTEETGFVCDGIELDADIYDWYLSPDQYSEAVFGLGFNDIEIIGLPADIREFVIVENDPDMPLWLRDEFCNGWQPIAGEVELFCFVPDFELDDAVVVSVDEGQIVVVPSASILVARRFSLMQGAVVLSF